MKHNTTALEWANWQLGVKARLYKLRKNPEKGLEKFPTRGLFNIYLDRAVYISEKKYKELQSIIFFNFCNPLNPDSIKALENTIFDFIKECFWQKKASFEPSDSLMEIPMEPYFEYY
jgi:hypothetical protein